MPLSRTSQRRLITERKSTVQTIASFSANGYDFEVDVDPDSPLGSYAMQLPIEQVMQAFKNTAVGLNANPSNIEELNSGATQVIYRIVDKD